MHPGLRNDDALVLMENHDEAYHCWRGAGLQGKTLVHIDTHDDMVWVQGQDPANIANFICPALQEGIVAEVFWVVPDETWLARKRFDALLRFVPEIIRGYPGKPAAVTVEENRISTAVLGRPLRVCTLGNLPRFSERVLLDIDVDYFMPFSPGNSFNDPGNLPWLWPDDLVARLAGHQLQSDMVTIAYSVEGGYTPLKWKYLGDELALRLRRSGIDDASLQGMALMREATQAAPQRGYQLAEEKYQQAMHLLPASAAPHLHLAHLYLDMGDLARARLSYQRALALDPSYRTAYNSAGHRCYTEGLLRQAEQEHRRTLTLDPKDAYAYLGLGRVAAKGQHWREAEDWLRKALALDSNLVDAYRTLGKMHARLGRVDAAITAYERSLLLALRGHKPLTDYIATEYQGLADPDHFLIHGRLARLYDTQGEAAKAISGYRMSIAKGGDAVSPRTRLAHLYLKQGQWRLSAQEAWMALKMTPREVCRASRRFWRRLIEIMKSRLQSLEAK